MVIWAKVGSIQDYKRNYRMLKVNVSKIKKVMVSVCKEDEAELSYDNMYKNFKFISESALSFEPTDE